MAEKLEAMDGYLKKREVPPPGEYNEAERMAQADRKKELLEKNKHAERLAAVCEDVRKLRPWVRIFRHDETQPIIILGGKKWTLESFSGTCSPPPAP
ncbi:MAG: hypothetical protein M3O22_02900 [Pseudomonadota bacterium]|nr:hypothetical protein [Pseudomonadota bacterium]